MSKSFKLVFLPGMDGTGNLFKDLIGHLGDSDHQIVSYPTDTNQDYQTLISYVKSKLPGQDYVLIAESFSGPIAAELIKDKELPGLRAVFFVATFLSPPHRFLLAISRLLPLKVMNKLPGSRLIYQKLFFGGYASNKLLNMFNKTINSMPTKVLNERLRTMQSLNFRASELDLPAAYLLPSYDMLVSKTKVNEFRGYFPKLKILEIAGPHFILQARPEESAGLLREFIESL